MARPSINERLALHEELLERLVANQTNLVDLYRSQESNGILFSGTVNLVGASAATGTPDSWRHVLDFPVPFAGFRLSLAPGGDDQILVSNYTWADPLQPPGVGYGIEPTPGIELPGIMFLGADRLVTTGWHLAGMTLQISQPTLAASSSWSNITLTVYSDPRMVF